MRVIAAVSIIRELIDESDVEYFSDTEIYDALFEAQRALAQMYWNRGEKEAIRKLLGNEVVGEGVQQLSYEILAVEAVLIRIDEGTRRDEPVFVNGIYLPNDKYVNIRQIQSRNQAPSSHTYTLHGNGIDHNGFAANVYYYRMPYPRLPDFAELELAEYTHPNICATAAALLYQKEVPLNDESRNEDKKLLSSLYDLHASGGSQ